MPQLPIADKATLDAVKALIGSNADAAGVATVFARLAQIADYVDTVESVLGKSTDANAKNTTIFAALKYIADYVGTNTDAAGMNGSVHAALKQIAAYVDTLETNLGSNASAANAAGDVHAKLKDIKTAVIDSSLRILTPKFATGDSTGTNATVVSVTGKGVINKLFGSAKNNSSSAGTVAVKFNIDGIEVVSVTPYAPANGTGSFELNGINWRFNTSFSIVCSANGGGAVHGEACYSLG